jgi:hypothetical protein
MENPKPKPKPAVPRQKQVGFMPPTNPIDKVGKTSLDKQEFFKNNITVNLNKVTSADLEALKNLHEITPPILFVLRVVFTILGSDSDIDKNLGLSFDNGKLPKDTPNFSKWFGAGSEPLLKALGRVHVESEKFWMDLAGKEEGVPILTKKKRDQLMKYFKENAEFGRSDKIKAASITCWNLMYWYLNLFFFVDEMIDFIHSQASFLSGDGLTGVLVDEAKKKAWEKKLWAKKK